MKTLSHWWWQVAAAVSTGWNAASAEADGLGSTSGLLPPGSPGKPRRQLPRLRTDGSSRPTPQQNRFGQAVVDFQDAPDFSPTRVAEPGPNGFPLARF